MRYLTLLLFITYLAQGAELPPSIRKDIDSFTSDMEKYRADFDKKCSDRKASILIKLRAQMAVARGEDVIAIKGVIDELGGEGDITAADSFAGKRATATASKQPLISKQELDEVRKERELGIYAVMNTLRDRILTAFDSAQTISDIQVATQSLRDFATASGGMYPSGRSSSTGAWKDAYTENIGRWCSADPIARFAVLKKAGLINSDVDAARFIRAAFDPLAADPEKFKEAVKKFAISANDRLFDKFK